MGTNSKSLISYTSKEQYLISVPLYILLASHVSQLDTSGQPNNVFPSLHILAPYKGTTVSTY
jgi:hypothetical protein